MAEQGKYEGKGKSLQQAIDKAWDDAPKKANEETKLWVDRIWVEGRNPPTWYGVILTDNSGS